MALQINCGCFDEAIEQCLPVKMSIVLDGVLTSQASQTMSERKQREDQRWKTFIEDRKTSRRRC
jgi:hypothetical protein